MTDSRPLVSMIIPVYNEQESIEACLRSVQMQTYEPLEVIMIDDESTDNTVQIAQKFKVRLLRQEHQGPGAARNLGAREAGGEILVFADADMQVHPEYVEKLVAPIITGDVIGTTCTEVYNANPSNIWSRCYNIDRGIPLDGDITIDVGESRVFRAILKSEFDRVGGFDNTGYDDDQSLYHKLGIVAPSAKGAICYHANPSSLKEVFLSARWSVKGSKSLQQKLGRLIKTSFPAALAKALVKAAKSRIAEYVIYKLVYDFGAFCGSLESILCPVRHYK